MTKIAEKFNSIGLEHFSPSQLTRPISVWMFEYVALSKEARRTIIVGENAAFGTSVHQGVQGMLCAGQDIDAVTEDALTSFDFHPANKNDEKRKAYRDLIKPAIENGVELLGAQFGNSEAERKIELHLPNVYLPIIGYVDIYNEKSFCEMKTKAPRQNPPKKDGTRTFGKASLPKEPTFDHILQSAVYHRATGATPHIAYISADDGIVFDPSNCDMLKPDGIGYAIEEIRKKAILRQNLINISTEPKVLAGLIEADFNHPFYWDHNFKQEAKDLWKV